MSITSQVKLLSEATGNFFQISSSGDVAADSTDDSSTSGEREAVCRRISSGYSHAVFLL